MELELFPNQESDLPPIVEHEQIEFVLEVPYGMQPRLAIGSQTLEPFLRPGDGRWRWRWSPGPAVGLHRLALDWEPSERAAHTWTLRVAPRKIDQDRYETLLFDIQRTARRLAYTLGGISDEGAILSPDGTQERSAAEVYYSLFEKRFDSFERAVRRIAARPREQLDQAAEQRPIDQATALDTQALSQAARGPFDEAPPGIADELQEAIQPGGGLLPRNIMATRSVSTSDTYEHRLLKRLLELLALRARQIGALAEAELACRAINQQHSGVISVRHARIEQIAAGCTQALQRIRELGALPALAEAGPLTRFHGPTPLFQRDPFYREVYRMWRDLRSQPYLSIESSLLLLPIADLPRLYERWCALQVVQALLLLGGELVEQQLVDLRRSTEDDQQLDAALKLPENIPLVIVEHPLGRLSLRYQPHYRPRTKRADRLGSLDRHTRIPDLVIERERPGAAPQVLVLDAKYRLDSDGHGVPQDALSDAYTYLAAIGQAGLRATLGVILLYPGSGAQERYESGVGTLPLLPGRTESLASELEYWLDVRGHS